MESGGVERGLFCLFTCITCLSVSSELPPRCRPGRRGGRHERGVSLAGRAAGVALVPTRSSTADGRRRWTGRQVGKGWMEDAVPPTLRGASRSRGCRQRGHGAPREAAGQADRARTGNGEGKRREEKRTEARALSGVGTGFACSLLPRHPYPSRTQRPPRRREGCVVRGPDPRAPAPHRLAHWKGRGRQLREAPLNPPLSFGKH